MVHFLTLLSSALVAGVAIAQTPNASFNSSVVAQVAGEKDPGTKASWCVGQRHACDALCNKDATTNDCSPSDLSFNCTCASNNSSPMFQYYSPTMVSFVCNQYLGDCLAQTAMHADEQMACQQQIVCGNSSVDAYANSSAGQASSGSSGSSGSSTSTTSSATSMSATSGTTSSTASPSPSKAAAAALNIGTGYATGIFGTVLFGIFGLVI